MRKIYGISFLVAALIMTGAYYISYQNSQAAKERLKQQKIEEESLNAVKSDEEIVTNTTTYILEHYDAKEGTLTQETNDVPADFIGKSRQELIEYLEHYISMPTSEDTEKGFENFELLSFSAERIVLRKTYYNTDSENQYCLVEEHGFVVVYHADMEEIYSQTAIRMTNLPEDIQEEIKAGKYIKDISTLYDFLENYSS